MRKTDDACGGKAAVRPEGSLTVEAAILVPVLVIVLLPFLYLLRMTLFYTIFEQQVQEEVTKLGTMSYMLKAGEVQPDDSRKKKYAVEDQESKEADYDSLMGWMGSMFTPVTAEETEEDLFLDAAGALYLWNMLQEKWTSEELADWGVAGGWAGISFDDCRFFYKDEGHGMLIKAGVLVEWNSPVSFWQPEPGRIIRVTHAFMGEKDQASAAYQLAEGKESEETVYRIGSGMKYHEKSCFLIDKQVSALSGDEAKSKGLLPCSQCGGGSGDEEGGGQVFITPGGVCYHSAGCSIIFPDLTEMTLAEAQAAGLTPCGLCFGGAGSWFQ